MNVSEALAVLSLEVFDAELVTDAFEGACFREKSIFYKDPILPSLVDSKLKRIEKLNEAFMVLTSNSLKGDKISCQLNDLEVEEWQIFFLNYEKNKAILRRELANTFHPNIMITILKCFKNNEFNYYNKLIEFSELSDTKDLKLSSQTPIIEILEELQLFLEQGVINKSWKSLSQLSNLSTNFKLSKEIGRAYKLING